MAEGIVAPGVGRRYDAFVSRERGGVARRIKTLLAVLLATLLLMGCSGQEQGGQSKEEAATPETTAETTAQERTAAKAKATPEETTTKTAQATSPPSTSKGSAKKAEPAANAEVTVTVTRVVDGDTVEITPAVDGITDVRLIGVDTPETKKPNCEVQPYGPEASAFTTAELQGQAVGLEFDREKTDRYDRLLAYVYPPDGTMFNETLLKEGYARAATFPPNTRYVSRFEAAEAEAKAAGLGIWSLPPGEISAFLAGQCTPSQPKTPPEQPPQQPEPAPAPVPDIPAIPAPSAAPSVVPGGARCSDFATEAEAIAALPSNPQLDRDGDGQACESLP